MPACFSLRKRTNMEQHPVPQNVTTFQFRLIGDMTIKQFGYLAGGAIVGFICYKLPIPVFLSFPLGVGVFLLGFGMAFVPIEERPMDIWILSFIKSIYNPTQYTWQRQKRVTVSTEAQPTQPSINTLVPVVNKSVQPAQSAQSITDLGAKELIRPPVAAVATQTTTPPPSASPTLPIIHSPSIIEKLIAWLFPKPAPKSQTVTLPSQPKNNPPVNTADRQTDILSGVFAHRAKPAPTEQTKQTQPPSVSIKSDPFANLQMPSITGKPMEKTPANQPKQEVKTPSVDDQKHFDELGTKNKDLENKLADLAAKLQEKSGSEDRIVELQKQLTDVLSERQRMEAELTAMRTKLTQQPTGAPRPTQAAGVTEQPERRGPTVRIITPEGAIMAGLPKLTTFPNVVTGIIKDYDSNLLPGVLVTVRDKEGVPLRALKTNKLGQFAASTPLPNSTYFIEVEDPRSRFTFDRIQITLNGSLVPAVEVVAKSQKQIDREKLEKQIFGSQQF
jgi:hypothetical protein